jgi:hypothetical protein
MKSKQHTNTDRISQKLEDVAIRVSTVTVRITIFLCDEITQCNRTLTATTGDDDDERRRRRATTTTTTTTSDDDDDERRQTEAMQKGPPS